MDPHSLYLITIMPPPSVMKNYSDAALVKADSNDEDMALAKFQECACQKAEKKRAEEERHWAEEEIRRRSEERAQREAQEKRLKVEVKTKVKKRAMMRMRMRMGMSMGMSMGMKMISTKGILPSY